MKRIFGLGYARSSHRELYQNLAERFGVSPRLVFRLAHGKRASSVEEARIAAELCHNGVMKMKP